ncbi:hypothetical protein [Polaromonas sp. CG9_12]|nr:hypothetical protein [Polaromonas sp. CG9_12]
MSATELSAEIKRLRPAPVQDLVERDLGVIAAEQRREALREQRQEAQTRETVAKRDAERWRQEHALRAKAHDAGAWTSEYLTERAQIEAKAREAWLIVSPRLDEASRKASYVRTEVEARIRIEQAPARERVAKLESIQQQKQAAELAQTQRERDEKVQKTELAKAVVLAAKLHRAGKLDVSSDAVRRVLDAIGEIKGGDVMRQVQIRQDLDEPLKARALLMVVQSVAPQLEKHTQTEQQAQRKGHGR